MYKVSIIIPVYNAQRKIEKAISSIINQTMSLNDIEVIFVDDCSTDHSVDIIQSYCNVYPNFKLIQLESNSGGPSKPRNTGILAAKGDFVLFLDPDDMLLENSCNLLYHEANSNDYDIVRGYLKVVKDRIEYRNRLDPSEFLNVSNKELIRNLMAKQSSSVDGIFRREFLVKNNILFKENIRLGEDTLFLSECYSKTNKIKYIDECVYEYVKRDEVENVSSTQRYGSKELNDHLTVWSEARNTLRKIGFDYFRIRVHVGVKTAVESLLNYSNNAIPLKDFEKLRAFLTKHPYIISSVNLNERLREILNSILEGNYEKFVLNTRKRILINGYDLKFIKPLIPYLQQKYEVKVDEWQGHEKHDEQRSRELLQWADVVFCEWMLGNAVWYSHHKLPHQLLFIRMHRFELYKNYGNLINVNNVDQFITIGMYYFEEFIRQFNLPRHKVRYIPNCIDFQRFNKPKLADYLYNLAIIGILPARKRVDFALDVLEKLLEYDPNYKLHIIGQKPEEVPWVWNVEEERKFYEAVYDRIENNARLKNAVIFVGWQDTAEYLRKIGFVLSVSDYNRPEGSHVSIAEGMASGAIGLLLNWPGVEYVYPAEFIVNSIDDMVRKIIELKDEDRYNLFREKGMRFIRDYYEISKIASQYDLLIQKGFLRRN